jgi:hypothetical protein
MSEAAAVAIDDARQQLGGYAPHAVNRRTVFTFNAGSEIYQLVDPTGVQWVMQSWSRQVDPTLGAGDLAALGARLRPPPGWAYSASTLAAALDVDTRAVDAAELQNSYSRRTA